MPISVSVRDGVAWATVDHPPMNLWDRELGAELGRVIDLVEHEGDVRVVVLASADPDYFVAHADVGMILRMPTEPEPAPATGPGPAVVLLDRLRSMPKITIAAVGGVARGGGAELALSCDLRYVTPATLVGQPEVPLGIIPGAGGTQRLARLLGRARALEHVVTGFDLTGEQAAAVGWANAVVPGDRLHDHVREVAVHIASLPAEAVRRAKHAVDAAFWDPMPGWLAEVDGFRAALATPDARRRMQQFLDAGGQTRAAEWGADAFRRLLP